MNIYKGLRKNSTVVAETTFDNGCVSILVKSFKGRYSYYNGTKGGKFLQWRTFKSEAEAKAWWREDILENNK